MAICSKCGAQVADQAQACPQCGMPVQPAAPNAQVDAVKAVLNTPDVTASFDPADINGNKVMAILAYISILVLIPIFAAPNSRYARYHANQGLILLIVEVIINVIFALIGAIVGVLGIGFLSVLIGIVQSLIGLVTLALAVLGIVNVAQGKAKPLPLIGSIVTLLK